VQKQVDGLLRTEALRLIRVAGEIPDRTLDQRSPAYRIFTALLGIQYTRDALGRITQKTQALGGATETHIYA
jgi:hypothetical protein